MAGRGLISDEYQNVLCKMGEHIVYLDGLDQDSSWVIAREPLHSAADNYVIRRACGNASNAKTGKGPGLSFALKAHRLLKNASLIGPDFQIGLIPTAVGGSRIEYWRPGAVLFNRLIAQVRAGVRIASENGRNAKVRGILFYQGESDACQEDLAEYYRTFLQDFLRGIRREFGADVPIVICLISGSEYRLPFKAAVRKAQISAPEFCTALNFVDTEDLEFQDDGLHLTSGSQHILGGDLLNAGWIYSKLGLAGCLHKAGWTLPASARRARAPLLAWGGGGAAYELNREEGAGAAECEGERGGGLAEDEAAAALSEPTGSPSTRTSASPTSIWPERAAGPEGAMLLTSSAGPDSSCTSLNTTPMPACRAPHTAAAGTGGRDDERQSQVPR
eukprot:CAMPEP_0113699286 /NCGR_PEP_ID=MMETSP0038_2-20120614/23217_1 /TAXON_ID=2898 /ORGANISM="Cryptomonas paramecium" /LENGTH=388 /DNA_ID=CAMNT_0000622615 /DNA_START=1 /DNA_END=1167 /DNA_ORIENTATION=- /assembly_acc=CAM_ASM_000170